MLTYLHEQLQGLAPYGSTQRPKAQRFILAMNRRPDKPQAHRAFLDTGQLREIPDQYKKRTFFAPACTF